ncbi:MAG: class I SAM-dependent methyltransferase [Candidatus Helarchaeota archaeon]
MTKNSKKKVKRSTKKQQILSKEDIEQGFALFKKNHDSIETLPKFISSLFSFTSADTVLDIGSGLGFPVLQLASLNPMTQFFAIDVNPDYIQQLKNTIGKKNINNIQTKVCEAKRLSFGDSFFSQVISAFTFQDFYLHKPYLFSVVKEIKRVLRMGGRGLIIVPYRPAKGGDIWNQMSYRLSLESGLTPHQLTDFEKGYKETLKGLKKYNFQILKDFLLPDGVNFQNLDEAKDVLLKFLLFINQQLWEKSTTKNFRELRAIIDDIFNEFMEEIEYTDTNVKIPKMNRLLFFKKE